MPRMGRDLFRFIRREAREAAEAGHWDTAAGSVDRHVELSILAFVSRLIYADDTVSNSELGFLREVLGDSPELPRTIPELQDAVQRAAGAGQRHDAAGTDPPVPVPAYIRAILARDLATGSARAAMVVDALFHLGIAVIAADGRETEDEVRTLIEYTHALRSELMRAGLDPNPTTHEDDAEIRSVIVPADALSLEPITSRLDALAGRDRLKRDVLALANLIRVRRLRAERGLPNLPMSFHIVFTGGPGSGKSAIARVIAEMYHALGLVSRGHVVEVDRALLMAGPGPALMTHLEAAITDALGGVLLLDPVPVPPTHAWSAGPARETVDLLIRAIDRHGDDLAIILAAPAPDMRAFLDANPTLRARINVQLEFDEPETSAPAGPARTM